MAWDIATAQSPGGRENQEDAFLIVPEAGGGPLFLAVADGAGGHADGEKASQAAVASLKDAMAQAPRDAAAAKSWLAQAIAGAHRRIGALGQGVAAPRSTLVALWSQGGRAVAGHVGDSRLYHFSDGKLAFRSRDHSVVQLLVDMGRLKEEDIADHPDRSRLTRALGGGEAVDADISDFVLAPGDGLALCSDGVWEHIQPPELATALRTQDLDRAARELVQLAVKRGGADADNATLVLARRR
ncbi:MAG: PP2C family serine/threonine-protein phosphatase [Reyranellaceae bacterium]